MTDPAATEETIVTDRLILRAHRPDDIEAYGPLWAPPAEGRSFTPVLDDEGAWARLLRLVGHRTVLGFAPFVVAERATGAIVGEAGFAHFRRGLGDDFDGVPEAMWIVRPDRRGDGYGREAMAAAVGWFDRRFPGRRSVCMIEPSNAVSLRLAAGLGFSAYRQATRHGGEVSLHQRT